MKPIVQKDAQVLRKIATEIPTALIKSHKVQTILKEMKVALDSQEDGVAIAAPQIGYPLRIFIVSTKIGDIIKDEKKKSKKSTQSAEENKADGFLKNTVFINPVLKKVSQQKVVVEEGCLSVRYLYGKVKRSSKAIVEAYDESGMKFIKGGSGLLAQIFQHEIDHLNGILFIDKAKYIEEIIPDHILNQHGPAKK